MRLAGCRGGCGFQRDDHRGRWLDGMDRRRRCRSRITRRGRCSRFHVVQFHRALVLVLRSVGDVVVRRETGESQASSEPDGQAHDDDGDDEETDADNDDDKHGRWILLDPCVGER